MSTVVRLYQQFQPSHYEIALDIDPSYMKVGGTAAVEGQVMTAGEVRLHAKNLAVTAITIDQKPASWREETNDTLVIEQAGLQPGNHSISVIYSLDITDGMHGIYPCYFTHDGKRKKLIATQFESHHAREAFPCIDEPEAKATFDLRLTTASDIEVLGNMPVKKSSVISYRLSVKDQKDSKQKTENRLLKTEFETSPKMSTYLLAFVVGELVSKTAKTKDGVDVRVFATPAQPVESLDFALTTAVKAIEFFNDYFGVSYPLPKSDHVALPDFSAGAMENWGLITYRETCLLVDEANTSIPAKEYVATVITHELSHQWFGDLVTMRWWDDLWLNESFASLMECVAVDALYPEWNTWLDFATSRTLSAQRRDSLPGAQAVRTPVNHPDEISTLFDPSIVYSKGAKLLQMVYYYIGEEAFRLGLKNYFTAHAYGNTSGSDLWQALAAAAGKNLQAFMTAWLDKPGYPLVKITQTDNSAKLSQSRFLTLKPANEPTSKDYLWPIPLRGQGPLKDAVLESPELEVKLDSKDILKLNMSDQSFFITKYVTDAQRQALSKMIADKSYSPIDRLQLLNESLLLARGGEGTLVEAMDLLQANKLEDSEPVWSIMSSIIQEVKKVVEEDSEATKHLKQLVRQLVSRVYKNVGWQQAKDEPAEQTKLRSLIISLAVWSEHEEALRTALKLFSDFKRPADIAPDLRSTIYSAGIKHGGEVEFEKLLNIHKSTHSAEERDNLCAGMTSAVDPKLITKELQMLKDQSIIRLQDVDHWFVYLIRNIHARDATWQWMVSNWQWIEDTFKSDKSYDSFVRYAAGALQGEAWLNKYNEFFEPKSNQLALKRVIEIGRNDITARTALVNREFDRLSQYLAASSKP